MSNRLLLRPEYLAEGVRLMSEAATDAYLSGNGAAGRHAESAVKSLLRCIDIEVEALHRYLHEDLGPIGDHIWVHYCQP